MSQPFLQKTNHHREKTMTHDELIEYGCEFTTADDLYGDIRSGYWMPGDGEGQGFGDFLGETEEAATEAIEG